MRSDQCQCWGERAGRNIWSRMERGNGGSSHCWVYLNTPSVLNLLKLHVGQTFAGFLLKKFILQSKTDYKNHVEFKYQLHMLLPDRNRNYVCNLPRLFIFQGFYVYFLHFCQSIVHKEIQILIFHVFWSLYDVIYMTSTSQCYQYDSTTSECNPLS